MNNERAFFSRRWEHWSRWDIYAGLVIVVSLLFQVSNWPKLPIFMDCYYHLAVMQGFQDAGGWVGRAFWEYAPVGRPHVYPPLFHLLEMAVSALGVSSITVARFFQFLVYPLFLGAMAWLVRSLYSARIAFFLVFLLFSSTALYLSVLILIPFTLAFLFGFLAFWFLERGRWVSASLALALAFYSHTMVGIFFLVSFFFYGSLAAQARRCAWKMCALALILAGPWLGHLIYNASYLRMVRVQEFYFTQINIFVFILAAAGLWISWLRRGRYAYMVVLSLCFLPIAFIFRNRFFSGQGLILFSLCAAVVLDALWARWAVFSQTRRVVSVLILVLFFYVGTPIFEVTPERRPVLSFESRLLSLAVEPGAQVSSSAREQTLYFPKLMDASIGLIHNHLGPDELFFCNFNYVGGLFSVLSHRATTNAMLVEAKPFYEFDPVAAARLIVWFKEPEGGFPKDLEAVVSAYGLKPLAETDIVYLYINEKAQGRRKVVPASVPSALIYLMLGGVLAVIILEARLKNEKNKD